MNCGQELAGFCCSHRAQPGFVRSRCAHGHLEAAGQSSSRIFNFFSCCNKEQSMCCIYLSIEQNLFGKLFQKKPCILFMAGQARRVKRLCQELLMSCASPRAMATLLCLLLLAGIPEMMPGAWAHGSSSLGLGNDGYRATVTAWSFAF